MQQRSPKAPATFMPPSQFSNSQGKRPAKSEHVDTIPRKKQRRKPTQRPLQLYPQPMCHNCTKQCQKFNAANLQLAQKISTQFQTLNFSQRVSWLGSVCRWPKTRMKYKKKWMNGDHQNGIQRMSNSSYRTVMDLGKRKYVASTFGF